MPLILAIEPDSRQAAHLTSVVRRRVGAELILVDTTERALDAIGNRVPDLILVPALLSPQDDAALATALRVIATAAQVQMLTIPVLGGRRPSVRSAGGLLGLRRERPKSAEPDGCDPAVFAEQIASYLERAAQESASLAAESAFDDTAPAAPLVAPVEVVTTEELSHAAPPVDATDAEVTDTIDIPRAVDESVWIAIEQAVRTHFLDPTPELGPASRAQLMSSDEPANAPLDDAPASATVVEASMLPLDEFMAELEHMQLPTIEASEGGDWAPPVLQESTAIDEDPDVIDIDLTAEMDEGESFGEDADTFNENETVVELGAIEDVTMSSDHSVVFESPLRSPLSEKIDERVWVAVEQAIRARFLPVAEGVPDWQAVLEHARAVEEPRDGELWMPLGAWNRIVRPDLEGLPAESAPVFVPAAVRPPLVSRGEREWVELIASLRDDIERLRGGSKPVPPPSAPGSPRSGRTAKLAQDEWGLFDPQQCGFAALLAKLEEVTESEERLQA